MLCSVRLRSSWTLLGAPSDRLDDHWIQVLERLALIWQLIDSILISCAVVLRIEIKSFFILSRVQNHLRRWRQFALLILLLVLRD